MYWRKVFPGVWGWAKLWWIGVVLDPKRYFRGQKNLNGDTTTENEPRSMCEKRITISIWADNELLRKTGRWNMTKVSLSHIEMWRLYFLHRDKDGRIRGKVSEKMGKSAQQFWMLLSLAILYPLERK